MTLRLSVLLFLAGLCSLACCLPQYHFINTALSWSKAQAYCRERSTDLATIFNIKDMNRLVNTAQDSTGGFTEKAWIGLRDNLTSWRWSFSNSSYYRDQEGNYRNWYHGQPDNFLGDQMCVKMWSGGVWQDTQCFLRNPFICYDGSKIPDLPFIFVEQELSWSDAQVYCRKRYTDLASVRNERENKEIQLLANNKSIWIGLYRTREWSDKSDSNYRYWQQGQPDNVGEKQECVATDLGNGGLWSDEECNRELNFICYRDSEQPVLSTTTTTTETPNKITTTEGASTTTKTTFDEIPNQPSLPTTTTTETPNKITTIEGHPSSPEITSSEQPSTLLVDQTTFIPVTPNKRTTTETETTTSHLSTEITSSEQPSTTEVDQTSPITDETPTEPVLFTTTITTLRRTEMTSSEQPSTTLVDQTTSIPDQTSHEMYHSTITTVTPNKRTASETESTTSHLSTEITSSEQPSTPEVDQTRPFTDETSTKRLLSTTTTTMTPNKITTTEGDLPSTEITSKAAANISLLSTTTVIPDQRTTFKTKSTISHLSTEITSSEQPSTPEEDQTRPITDETPTEPLLSTTTTTTMTSNKITTIERDSRRTEMTSAEQPSTSLVDQTTSIPEVSSQQYSTPKGGQTRSNEHVINMRVKFTSKVQLSEDDMEKLFHDLLIEMGLPTSIKVGLKRSPKK